MFNWRRYGRFAVGALALAVPVHAGTVFVAPDGNDANPGSREFPRRHIKTELAGLAAGDSLVLLPGVYTPIGQGPGGLSSLQLPADSVTVTAAIRGEAIIDWSGASDADPFLWQTTTRTQGTLSGLVFRNWSGASHFLYNATCRDFRVAGCTFDGVSPLGSNSVVIHRFARGAAIDSCTFAGRSAESLYYAVTVQGQGAGADEFAVRHCTFNTEADLADTLGRGGGVQAVTVDSLLIEGCVGYNAGHNTGLPSGLHHFVSLADVSRARVADLTFKRYLRDGDQSNSLNDANGVKIGSWAGNPSHDIHIDGCAFWGAGHGVHVGNAAYRVKIEYVWCDSTYDDGIFIDDQVSDSSVEYVVTHHAQDNGIDVQGTGISVRNCTVVRSRNAAINVSTDASGVVCSDNLIYDVRDPEVRADEFAVLADPSTARFDHDLWFDPDGAQDRFYVDGDGLTFGEWQITGQDVSGLNVDPLFYDPEGRAWPRGSDAFTLCSDSPALFGGSGGGTIGALGVSSCVVTVESDASVVASFPRPNPVLLSSRASVNLGVGSSSDVSIFDARGRLIRRLVARELTAAWDLRNERGRLVSPGVYFVRAERLTSKLTVLP